MDVHEFLKRVKPSAKRSKLAPYWEDIALLLGRGYSLKQVREFLASNGVSISIPGLSKYIQRRQQAASTAIAPSSSDSSAATTRKVARTADTVKAHRPVIDLEDFTTPDKDIEK